MKRTILTLSLVGMVLSAPAFAQSTGSLGPNITVNFKENDLENRAGLIQLGKGLTYLNFSDLVDNIWSSNPALYEIDIKDNVIVLRANAKVGRTDLVVYLANGKQVNFDITLVTSTQTKRYNVLPDVEYQDATPAPKTTKTTKTTTAITKSERDKIKAELLAELQSGTQVNTTAPKPVVMKPATPLGTRVDANVTLLTAATGESSLVYSISNKGVDELVLDPGRLIVKVNNEPVTAEVVGQALPKGRLVGYTAQQGMVNLGKIKRGKLEFKWVLSDPKNQQEYVVTKTFDYPTKAEGGPVNEQAGQSK